MSGPRALQAQRDIARALVGKTISRIALQPFDPNDAETGGQLPMTCDPVIVFTDGTCLRLLVDETEIGEYGMSLVYPARPPGAQRARARSKKAAPV